MTGFWITILIFYKITVIENRMIPLNYITIQPASDEDVIPSEIESNEDNPFESVIGLKDSNIRQHDRFAGRHNSESKKPCSIVVLSNVQNPSMQSLLRKYKYDANGVLIPSSVKYYMKLPQGFGSAPLLVPLNDKAFSPLGGFVRYYKEVPPIPQSW